VLGKVKSTFYPLFCCVTYHSRMPFTVKHTESVTILHSSEKTLHDDPLGQRLCAIYTALTVFDLGPLDL